MPVWVVVVVQSDVIELFVLSVVMVVFLLGSSFVVMVCVFIVVFVVEPQPSFHFSFLG